MASRKGINIYFLKYFIAVRNCINIFVLYVLEVRLIAVPINQIDKSAAD